MIHLSPLNRRRLGNFRANRRAFWSLWIFLVLFIVCLFAELVANDQPFLVKFQGDYLSPLFQDYPETRFGGDFLTPADYQDPFVQELIRTGGDEKLDPGERPGWILWPPIPFSYDTIDYDVATAPSPPDSSHILGTDDQARDVLARIIYGFRLSVLFGFGVTICSAVIVLEPGIGEPGIPNAMRR